MSERAPVRATRPLRAWEKALLGVRVSETPSLLPGLAMAGLLAWLSFWLSDAIGQRLMGLERSPVSPVMMAILLGLIVRNSVSIPPFLRPGFTFAVKKVLRLGIILLGIRLSVFDVFRLGGLGVPIVVACLAAALFFTTRLTAWLRLPDRLGTLIAVGTSICGVSAIVATGPAIEAEEEEVAYAVAVITAFGIAATLGYPYLANTIFGGDPVAAGLFLGTSVHDTSQVTGSALVYADVFSAPRALDVATVTKLVRNVFMALVVPLMALRYARRSARGIESTKLGTRILRLFPLFILGFLAVAALRSIGDVGVRAGRGAFGLWDEGAWTELYTGVKAWAVSFLVVALAGVGLSTDVQMVKGLGVKPFVVGLGAALLVGVVSVASISLLGLLPVF